MLYNAFCSLPAPTPHFGGQWSQFRLVFILLPNIALPYFAAIRAFACNSWTFRSFLSKIRVHPCPSAVESPSSALNSFLQPSLN
jgi:hypothetical protein